MKILLLTGSINQGGAEFQLLALANLLQRKGHDIQVLALTNYSYFLPYIAENKIKYSYIASKRGRMTHVYKSFLAIKKNNPDIVISFLRTTSLVALLARIVNLFSYKLIISERTSLILPSYDLFYFNFALIANKITVNSTSKLTYIIKRFPLLKNRTTFIPNIINIGKFMDIERDLTKTNYTKISYVGRISPEKNLLNLIKSIQIVKNNRYNISLSLYGEANNKKYLKELCDLIIELDLKSNVIYEGATSDISDVYKKTDLLCLVSLFEGFSNVLSEAISCGIPVIASNIEENRFLIEDTKNGFLVDPYDPKNIAEGIIRFLKLSLSEVNEISKNNKQKAIETFNEDAIYAKYLEIFNHISTRNSK